MKEMLDQLFSRISRISDAVNGTTAAVVVAGGVLLIGAIVWANLRSSPRQATPMPDGIEWICANGHEFTLTGEQLSEHLSRHAGDPVLCPTCGAPAARAVKCPHCGHVVVPDADHLCPVCKQPLRR
jgi:rubrerythrin